VPFKDTLNDPLRVALAARAGAPKRKPFKIKAYHMGYHPCLEKTNTEEMLECLEGKDYR
jgi:hypothetical protein